MSSVITCQYCYRQLPKEDFLDGSGIQCKFCLADYQHEKATEELEEKAKDVLAKVLDAGEALSPVMPVVQDTITEIYTLFGGPRGFANKINNYLTKQLSLPKPPGHLGSLMLGLLKIQLQVEAQREATRVNTLTDEQIKREQALEVAKMFMSNLTDPKKRQNLEQTLNAQGLTITQLTPEAIIEHAANRTFEAIERGSDEKSEGSS